MQSMALLSFPNKEYQTLIANQTTERKILSFSRSLSQLKPDNKLRQRTHKQVKQMVINRKPLTFKQYPTIDPIASKKLSKLYDAYPVTKMSQEPEYLPFIPCEQLHRTVRIDPKFQLIYFPKVKYPKATDTFTSKEQLFVGSQREVKVLYSKKEVKYLDSEESFQPFTTLKEYLLEQSERVKPAPVQRDEL